MNAKQKPARSKAQMRIAIAKDAIKQINGKAYRMKRSNWASWEGERIDQQILAADKPPKCECCAMGAALLSSIRLYDECAIDRRHASSNETHIQLEKFFSGSQIALIESSFEDGDGYYIGTTKKTRLFYARHPNDTKRALAIFRNIVRNKGTFKP